MIKKNPRVSVIVPAYNAENVIGRCLQTIKEQTFKNFEVLVINDASLDNTFSVIQECTKNDSRLFI